MSDLSHRLAGAVVAVLGMVVLTGTAAGAAQADTAAVDSFPPGTSTAISGPGGKATVTGGDWFGFVVVMDPNLPNSDSSNKWHQSTEAYTRDGLVYRTYRHIGTGDCLSHMPVNEAGGLLITEPCVWSDNSQWWAVDHVLFQVPPCPPDVWPFCPPHKYVDILIPWDAPERAATVRTGVLELHMRGGAVGTAAQRLSVQPFPKLPH
jgi:hypothetical protein